MPARSGRFRLLSVRDRGPLASDRGAAASWSAATMTPHPDRPTTAALLGEHVGWLRELARHLCADAHLAEDLAQEACVAALEAPPREGSKLRPWLATVLRNELRQRARGGARRDARERSVAREEALEATDRIVERIALERELVGHVL